ncbi:Condensin-2 complex subunit d3 [Globisporangium polare]
MELEKELVAALRALELREVPEDMVASLFNSGGTAVVTTSATGETASAGDPLFPDIVDNVSVNQLRSVDRAFTKYLHKHLAALEENQESAARRLGVGDNDVVLATEPEVARLWEFFASEEAITAVVGDENERTHSTAAYRTLFTLLHSVINIRDMYAKLDDDEKRRALAKALLASKVYLTWLQIPGGSAYGLFMPYVYRQVLDVLKRWIAMMRDDAITRAKENGILTTRRVSVRQRTLKEKQIAARRRDNEDFTEIQQKLAKFGLDLFGMMATFLSNFSLASSTESIIPTIEMVIVLQTAIPDDDLGEAVSEKSLKVLSKLLNGVHGNATHIARVVAHCFIPGITLQEPLAIENRCALRFHRLAIDIMARTERIIRGNVVNGDDDEREETEHQISLLRLGLLQNICLKAPERSEERQRVLAYAFSIAINGDAEQQQSARGGFQEEERVRLARFLASFSRNVNAKFRQFAVELIGKFVLQPEFWQTSENVSHELLAFSGVGPLLDVLIDRSRDKISTVRAKAIAGISSALTLGLSSMPLHSEAKEAESDDDDAMDGGAQGDKDDGSQLIALSLQKLLYSCASGLDGKKTMEETPLMRRLIELFRESLSDEKTFVRKAAVQALEALLVVRPGPIRKSMRKDLVDIHSKCTDSSLSVRVQAIKSLSAILLKFPQDAEVQKLWNLGILPLCADPEASVQASSLEWTNRLIFERILSWYDARKSRAQRESLGSVWNLVGHLDGVMVKCVQKSLRILIKEDKVDMKKILRACIYAIKECVSSAVTDDQSEGSDANLTRFWDFSWVVLEELAHTGKLVEASNVDKQSLDVVVSCWNKLQQQELPVEFNNGSKRILRVVAALSPVIDARDSKVIADGILASLHAFTIPLNVIADAVLALNSISKAKATTKESRRDVSFGWGKKLLDLCETNLRLCFENDPQRVVDETLLIQKQLICIGEVALLEFNKNDDKSRDPAEVALLPVSSGLTSLVQMFLLPQIAANQMSSTQAELQEDEEQRGDPVEPTDIPTPVRVCAFVTLGKLCLRDQELAKDCITMLIRELRMCKIQDIRSNILLILGDLCIRYTSLVDTYIPTIALSLLDDSPLIRRSALLLFSQLILQDYIKWRESLLRFFIRAVVDEDEELANLARHVLCGPLRQKSPHLFSNKFIEMIFVFNNYQGRVNFTLDRDGVDEIALPGNARFPQRFQLYRFLLQNMSDEQKLQISMKLCNEVLEEVTDGKLPLCKNPSQITDNGTEAVLKDTFAILCSSDIKLSSSKDGDDDVDGEEGVDASADPSSATSSGNVATQLAAAKGKLLSKMSKKNFLENVVPVLIGLKHKLESKRSPLMRYLQHYFHELFKLYRQEVKDILSADPQMAMEVEYDMRQFELHHKKQLEQQLHNRAPQQQPSVAAGNQAPPATPPKTPPSPSHLPTTTPYNMLDVSETPMEPPDSAVRLREEVNGANAKKIAARRRRRRRSLPAVESPLRVLEKRTTVAQDEEEAEELGGGGEPSVMLFSPNKDVPGSGGKKGGGWQVVVKSPTVSKKSKGKKKEKNGKKTGGSKAFTQEDLEQSMQQDIEEEDDDDAGHEAPSSSESPAEQETSRKKQSKSKSKAQQVLDQDEVEQDVEEEEEFVQLPLKKKSKKKAEKPAAPAKKKKSKGEEDEKRAKRKRD